MSETKFNPSKEEKSETKKKVAGNAAAAAAGAGLGVVGTMAANREGEIIHENVSNQNETETQQYENADAPIQEVSEIENESANDELQPLSSYENEDEIINEVEVEVVTEVEDIANNDNQEGINETDINSIQAPGNGYENEEIVNPDEIAEALIAEDQIDPNDIDVADVINFDEIGTVYTVDGESYTAATFHDIAGNELVMIDIDNDNVFDIITDMEGNLLVDESGVPIEAGGLTVDDAELDINDADTYLAADDTDLANNFGADSILDDIIS